MKGKKLIQDYSSVGLLKQFRDEYGFTQMELASLMEISRAHLSMVESLARSLPSNAVQRCLDLKQIFLSVHKQVQRNWEQYSDHRMKQVYWQCEQKIIAMEHNVELFKKELNEMEKTEQQQRTVIDNWDKFSAEAEAALQGNYKATITSRCITKLTKCDAAARLEKQLQIKIFLAGIDVLKGLIASQPSGVVPSPV